MRERRGDVVVPGDPDVTIRVHRPVGRTGPRPCVLSMHSGRYTDGDVMIDDVLLESWAEELGLVGVSVDYRLAPTTPYPGPITDCYTGLKWVHDNADDLGVDRSRIGLHGVGAGGGLAAALALVARDHREVPLTFQLLDNPMLDDRSPTEDESGWRAYLGELYGSADVPKYAVAARARNLHGLPAAFVSVTSRAGVTGLGEGGAADYAARLKDADVATELHEYPADGAAAGSARDKAAWLRRLWENE